MRYAPRRDSNEKRIIQYLERCGASVVQLDDPGVPDLLISYRGVTWLAEIKTKTGTLTPAQKKFFKQWDGRVFVVRSYHDAKLALRSLYMPTYTYKCKTCHKETTVVQSFTEDALTTCQHCAGELIRLIKTVPVVIYRGDGWAGKKGKGENV